MALTSQSSTGAIARMIIGLSILLLVIVVVSFVSDALSLGDLRPAEVDTVHYSRPSRGT
jgi:hypothetical protein